MTEYITPQHSGDELLKPLVEAIRQRHGPEIDVPDRVDAAVLADANAYLKTVSKPRRVASHGWKWAIGTLTAGSLAAAALLLAVLPNAQNPAAPELSRSVESDMSEFEITETQFAASTGRTGDDIDRNGRVDILDAFALARTIQQGGASQAEWDQNGDGQVNQDDVDLIARHAVML